MGDKLTLRDFAIVDAPCVVHGPWRTLTAADQVGVVARDGGFDVTYYADGATTVIRLKAGQVTVLQDRIVGIQHGGHID